MATYDVSKIKERKINELLYLSTLDRYEKANKIAKILNKTDEEIIEEEKNKNSNSFIADLKETYKLLFSKEEGDMNENKKNK